MQSSSPFYGLAIQTGNSSNSRLYPPFLMREFSVESQTTLSPNSSKHNSDNSSENSTSSEMSISPEARISLDAHFFKRLQPRDLRNSIYQCFRRASQAIRDKERAREVIPALLQMQLLFLDGINHGIPRSESDLPQAVKASLGMEERVALIQKANNENYNENDIPDSQRATEALQAFIQQHLPILTERATGRFSPELQDKINDLIEGNTAIISAEGLSPEFRTRKNLIKQLKISYQNGIYVAENTNYMNFFSKLFNAKALRRPLSENEEICR